MMVPHYTLAKPICCSGSDLVGRAFRVTLVEQKVTVVVGQVVEVEEQEESCIGASTANEMHSIKVAAEHRIEING